MRENKYMSKEYTNCLKGICAIVVVIHHLYQYTNFCAGTYFGEILQFSGSLAVAMFFFLSGYGLMASSAKEKYLKHFFVNKFLPLYCFYVVLIVLYSFWTWLLEKRIVIEEIMQSFLFGRTVVTNGWYIQAILVAYLLYLCSFKLFHTGWLQILTFGIAILVYCIFCNLSNLGLFWYNTIPCMVLGMICYYKKSAIYTLFKKCVGIIFVLSSLLFTVCLLIAIRNKIDGIFDFLYPVFFICTIVALSYSLCNIPIIYNGFFALCGNYSLEIYVSHGFFLRLIRFDWLGNKLIYVLIVVVGTILMSAVMKRIHTCIVSCFKNA